MKLSAENKISVKNAFSLHIIDYMSEMVRKKSSGLDNLQVRGNAGSSSDDRSRELIIFTFS